MNTTLRHFGYLLLCYGVFFGSGSVALAQVPTVVFEKTPLFLDSNIEPGDSEARTITVTNTGPTAEDVYVSSGNEFSTGLGEVMSLVVTAPGSTYFIGVFDDFFDVTPLALGSVASGETKVFTLSAALPSSAGNVYQTKQLGFDLIIGFVGGGSVTDNPGGGGGGGGGTIKLNIFNEKVDSVVGSTATLSWNTNLNASTYLVCGVVNDIPFTLSTLPPLFGYQFVLPEENTNTKVHKGILAGLDLGQYECRPAGRVSPSKPFTVGEALRFSITAPEGQVAGIATSQPTIGGFVNNRPTGSVLGASWGSKGSGPTYDEWKAELDAERAAKAALVAAAASSTVATSGDAINTASSEGESEEAPTTNKIAWWYWLILAVILLSGGFYLKSVASR